MERQSTQLLTTSILRSLDLLHCRQKKIKISSSWSWHFLTLDRSWKHSLSLGSFCKVHLTTVTVYQAKFNIHAQVTSSSSFLACLTTAAVHFHYCTGPVGHLYLTLNGQGCWVEATIPQPWMGKISDQCCRTHSFATGCCTGNYENLAKCCITTSDKASNLHWWWALSMHLCSLLAQCTFFVARTALIWVYSFLSLFLTNKKERREFFPTQRAAGAPPVLRFHTGPNKALQTPKHSTMLQPNIAADWKISP